jgi:prepilin-type N-terminal cleavage/methylation domain-containing protein
MKRQLRMSAYGFTLVELLVVIGIIAILIAILIPTIVGVRRQANDTRCAAQLREMIAATTIYHNLNKRYPRPPQLPAFGGPVPLALDEPLLNEIGRVLRWPELDYSMRVDALPPLASCPVRRELDLLMDAYPAAAFGSQWWNTGYSYCAGLDEMGSPYATMLAPARRADIRGKRRGVLWADNLILLTVGGAPGGYAYFHFKGSHEIDPAFITVVTPKSLRGHHRGWTDGSVEWLPRNTFDLAPAVADREAAYKVVGPSGLGLYFYY